MRYAAAMRYGGELVDAIDCDYEDYKYLGLLCPECKEPVFLRASGIRVVKDKEIPIGAHFCHFKTKDIELAKSCEQRVGGYTAEEIERRSAQSRGQRLRLLQQWFWEIVKDVPMRYSGDHLCTLGEGVGRFSSLVQKPIMNIQYKNFLNNLISNFGVFLESGLDYVESAPLYVEKSEADAAINNRIRRLRSDFDMKLHRKIVKEVGCFLASKAGESNMLALCGAFAAHSLFTCAFFESQPSDVDLQETLEEISEFICSIPWAEEFSKIVA